MTRTKYVQLKICEELNAKSLLSIVFLLLFAPQTTNTKTNLLTIAITNRTTDAPPPTPPTFSRHLHHDRSGHDDIIRQLACQRARARQAHINYAVQALRHDTPARSSIERRERRAAGDTTRGEGAEFCASRHRRIGALQLDLGPGSRDRFPVPAHRQRRKRRQDQIAALGTARDEGRRKAEHLLGRQGRVEGLRDCHHAARRSDEGLVARLNRQDRGRGCQDARVGHQLRRA